MKLIVITWNIVMAVLIVALAFLLVFLNQPQICECNSTNTTIIKNMTNEKLIENNFNDTLILMEIQSLTDTLNNIQNMIDEIKSDMDENEEPTLVNIAPPRKTLI